VVDKVRVFQGVFDVIGADDEAVLVEALPHVVEHMRVVQLFHDIDLRV
jgi:hypothetical protein